MDYLNEYLLKVLPISILELFAAIAGSYFLYKQPRTPIANRYLVYFLWLTFIVEMLGKYTSIAYFSEYRYFGFIENTVFERNLWLYNIYLLVSYSFFTFYFNTFLKNKLTYLIIAYLLFSIINLFFSDIYFNGYSVFTIITGSFLILFSVILFYFNLLQNNRIISLIKHLPIYISIGVLFFNLCMAPIQIFSQYFNSENDMYIKLSTLILLIANIFMYSIFIIGFLVCAKNKPKAEKSFN